MKITAINEYNQRNYSLRQNTRINNQNSSIKSLLNEEPKDTVSFKGIKGFLRGGTAGACIGGGIAMIAFGLCAPLALLASTCVGAAAIAGAATGAALGDNAEEKDKGNPPPWDPGPNLPF